MTSVKRRISVVGAAILRGGKVLITRRPPHDTGAGFWEFPGGKIEPGESPSQALVREIEEELAIHVRIRGDLGTHFHSYATVDIDMQIFLCEQVGGQLELREHDAADWVAPADLRAEVMLEADRPFILRLQQLTKTDGS